MPSTRNPKLEALMTTEAAAEVLRLKPETLATWRYTREGGGLPFVKLGGGRVRYRPSDVRAFIEQKLQAA